MSMLMNLAILHQLYSLCPTAPDECVHITAAMKNFSALPYLYYSCKTQSSKQYIGWAKSGSLAQIQFLGDGLREHLAITSAKIHTFESLQIKENHIVKAHIQYNPYLTIENFETQKLHACPRLFVQWQNKFQTLDVQNLSFFILTSILFLTAFISFKHQ